MHRPSLPTFSIPPEVALRALADRCKGSEWHGHPCHYCGQQARGWDHLIPYSRVKNDTRCVPCCQQCNGILGARICRSDADKAAIVKANLEKRLARLQPADRLQAFIHDPAIGPGIRESCRRDLAARAILKARIVWATARTLHAQFLAPTCISDP